MKITGKLKTKTSKEIESSVVSIGFEGLDRDLFTPEKSYDLLAESGVKYARVQTGWAKTERQKGVYDFAWLDSIVDNLIERGIRPWFNVGYGNPIYMTDVPEDNSTAVGFVPILYGEEVMTAWLNFIKALAGHFKGRVEEYEIWNEANCPNFWYPGEKSGTQYAELVKISSDTIKAVYPNSKTGACISNMVDDFTVEFFENLPAETIDFFHYHSYDMGIETNMHSALSLLRKIMNKNGHGNVRIGNGETGHPSWFPKNHWLSPDRQSSEDEQAIWLLRRYLTEASAGVYRISFYQAVDLGEKTYQTIGRNEKQPARHGLMTCFDYRPKMSHKAISHMAVILSGEISAGNVDFYCELYGNPREASKLRYHTFTKNGELMYVYYLNEYIQDARNVALKDSIRAFIYDIDAAKLEEPVVIDTFTGDIYTTDEADIKKEYGRTIISNLPVADYPMIICSRKSIEITE